MTQQFTYSGNVYNNAAGKVVFPLTSTAGKNIAYLQKAHIHVYSSIDSGGSWTELTRPSQWDFDFNGTEVTLTTAAVAGEWIKVQRITPYSDKYVTFQEGSLLTSDQLNQGEDFSMFVDQELFDQNLDTDANAITSVTAQAPIKVDNTTPGKPDLSLDRITTAEATSDPTNPSWSTDTKIATPGAVERVYANLMGTAAGFPGAGNKGKQGKLRIDNVSGAKPAIYYWDAAAGTPAWVQIDTEGPTGPQGPVGPAPGLQTPAGLASNVPNKGDGTVGDATVTVVQDSNGDLQFSFGVPQGIKGEKGDTGDPGDGVTYKGAVDATTDAPPANPKNGDFYVNTTAGATTWPGLTTVTVNDRLIWNATNNRWDRYIPVGDATNLGYTAAPDKGTITNDRGTNATVPLATTGLSGLLSPLDKDKLDKIANGAEVNVQSDWNESSTSSDAYIKNKPTIPTLVQSDWNQTNNSQPDFIKNKPGVASESARGIIQLATAAEVAAGTDAVKAVTPKQAADHYLIKNISQLPALP